jgi:2-beta-glucuronyltransferase
VTAGANSLDMDQNGAHEETGGRLSRFCIISAQHDYRSPRRASIHFIASELAKRGRVKFFSCRFSSISRFRLSDPRNPVASRANVVEMQDGVECYLWRPRLHPVALPRFMETLERAAFQRYIDSAPAVLRAWIKDSDVVIIESGISVLFFDLIKAMNPDALVVYNMSDDLSTIGAARSARQYLDRVAKDFDLVRVLSRQALNRYPGANMAFVPQGIDPGVFALSSASPYATDRVHAVSLGSMLFDPRFFAIAGPMFPEVEFHVIGSGLVSRPIRKDNVVYYPEMAFRDTVPFLQHAAIGLAPYSPEEAPGDLADTSLKLTQYGHIGLPAVCPAGVAGGHALRFGYDIREPETIRRAVLSAIAAEHVPVPAPSWGDVAQELIRLCESPKVRGWRSRAGPPRT